MKNFLKQCVVEYPTFKFRYSIDKYGFETIENLTDHDYYITISEHDGVIDNEVKTCYNIVITHKQTAQQQMVNSKDEQFVINTLRNLYYFGF